MWRWAARFLGALSTDGLIEHSRKLIRVSDSKQERKEDREGFFITERAYGRFYRAIPLPEGVNTENAKATFRSGVLELTLDAPKKGPQGKTIPIEESQKS